LLEILKYVDFTGAGDADDDVDIAVLLENKKKELLADMQLESHVDQYGRILVNLYFFTW